MAYIPTKCFYRNGWWYASVWGRFHYRDRDLSVLADVVRRAITPNMGGINAR